ncbi:MAG: alkaline phosphatase family protein [Candidatus Hydrogenedentota bacterium]
MQRTRPISVVCLAALLMAALLTASPVYATGRVVILGFDGVDPGIASEMMGAGELPNLAKLRDDGTFKPLASSNPPQSPTAWSSFATCRTPLNHGIFDFLRRNPDNYFPAPGFGILKRPDLAPDGSLEHPAEYESYRKGDTFWKKASDQGFKVKALVVPFAYPAENLSDVCHQICGLDVPDIRGTQSTYFAFSDDLDKQERVAGGMRVPLQFEGDTATVQVPGIAVPGQRGVYAEVPMTVTADRDAKEVTLAIQDQQITLAEDAWSEWLEWTFPLSDRYSVQAISRFHVLEAGEKVRLYMTCLQMHPRNPMTPISTPVAYSAELADRYGLYKTIGWAYDTKALQHDDLTEDLFLEDVARTMAWRERLTLDELERGNFDMLVAAWTAPDRVSHLFWRYRDEEHPLYTEEGAAKYGTAVEDTYKKMDGIVGNVMQKLGPDDLLMILSDHGFHSFRYGFSVNTWLIENGYLAVKGGAEYTDTKYLQGYDWSKTKAYGLGLGMIFLNREGREKEGTVPDGEVPALLDEIQSKLLAVTDPNTGDKVFNNVYTFPNPEGEAMADAPDIQLGYAEGYQTTKGSAAGAAPEELFSVNDDKWSGEHASSDVATTAGIFFTNKRVETDPQLRDLGVTALEYLGATVPAEFEGKDLL